MDFSYSADFRKRYRRLSRKVKLHIEERMQLLVEGEFNPLLNNHKLHGEYAKCRSINITGDLRLVYRKLSDAHIRLISVGTHSELYDN